MTRNSFSTHSHFQSSAALLLVALCHILILVFCMRAARPVNASASDSKTLASILVFKQIAENSLQARPDKAEIKRVQHPIDDKSRAQNPLFIDAEKMISVLGEDKPSGDANLTSPKDIASLDSLGRRYHLEVPKAPPEEALTPAQQAAQDPRTNSPKLTKSEQFAMAAGTLDCIFQGRLANGKTVREPGRWVIVMARAAGSLRQIVETRFCVRLHQGDDKDGNDLTEISAGIKGSL